VYGKRATPHEVLSELTRRVAANDDGLLELAARSLVDGTGAGRVEVRVTAGGREMTAAEWPPSSGNGSEDMSRFPITHRGTELGALVLAVPSGQHLADVDRVLATQVASSMGLALKNRSLTETLQRRVVQLRESRRRLVAVQDATRRRVERDLHDGAQQQLVALRVKLGLARAMADADGAAATLTAVDRLGDEADRVVDAVRDFAGGVYPPLLEAEGIGAAVTAAARQCPIHVSVDVDEIGRHDRDAESAVYACVVEALDNVAVHAAAHQAWVRISSCESALSFEVRDDGAGFDIGAVPRGVGLTNIADRVDALAGHVSMRSAPGCGTSVGGEIPVESVVRS
jgi:signal transduction histidine kinase